MTTGSGLRAETSPDRAAVHISRGDGTPRLTHRIGAGQRPSIHPLHAPVGDGILTEDSPAHHPWQHGLYTGFNLVNGIGFWKEQAEDGSFHPALVAGPEVEGTSARWALETAWRAPDGTTLIQERQDWSLVDEGSTFDLDLAWSLRAAADVEIGQYMAGGLFLRMPYAAATGGVAVNSEGQRNGAAEKQRARWAAVSMPIAGLAEWGGVAIMDHPDNPAHPVTWRVDNELGISPSRCIAGSWTIGAGETDRYRYRMHVFCGAIDHERLEGRWRRFASAS